MTKNMIRSLGIIFTVISFAAFFADAQSNAGTEESATTPVPIKLVDPHPGLPSQLLPQDINNAGEIVGFIGFEHNATGFIRSKDGEFKEFNFPAECNDFYGPTCTYLYGLNDRGEIVGDAVLQTGNGAFLREKNGSIRLLSVVPLKINNQGDIIGNYYDGLTESFRGFLLHRGIFTTIAFPGSVLTQCMGINNSGSVTGVYQETDGSNHGFLWKNGNFIATFQIVDANGAHNTAPAAINDLDQIAGSYSAPETRTFVRNSYGTTRTFDLDALLQPFGGMPYSHVTGINNKGDMVVVSGSGSGFSPIYGFLIPRGAAR